MWRAITRLIKRLALAILIVAVLAGGATYLLGPHAEIAGAYAAWKAAHDARDGEAVVRLSSPREIDFFDAQRKHAMVSARDTVAALPFRQRAEVLSYRSQVLSGSLPVAVLANPDAKAAFAEYVERQPLKPSVLPAGIMFAVPTGTTTARGYLDPSPGSGLDMFRGVIVFVWGIYYDFEKTPEGWQIDMTSVMERSASENEHWAVQMEPTGNAFIYLALGATDTATQERLWEPLDKQG